MKTFGLLMLVVLAGCGSNNLGSDPLQSCNPEFRAAYAGVYDSFHAAERTVTSPKFTDAQKLSHWQSVKASCDGFYAPHAGQRCRWSSTKPEVSGDDFQKICEVSAAKSTASAVSLYEEVPRK
ncbi:MAG: hypothetical protein K2X47_12550 [Bdellovibrionales bacterium]|nr:hypothetical protein [Bdellovibrionales bacterium]